MPGAFLWHVIRSEDEQMSSNRRTSLTKQLLGMGSNSQISLPDWAGLKVEWSMPDAQTGGKTVSLWEDRQPVLWRMNSQPHSVSAARISHLRLDGKSLTALSPGWEEVSQTL